MHIGQRLGESYSVVLTRCNLPYPPPARSNLQSSMPSPFSLALLLLRGAGLLLVRRRLAVLPAGLLCLELGARSLYGQSLLGTQSRRLRRQLETFLLRLLMGPEQRELFDVQRRKSAMRRRRTREQTHRLRELGFSDRDFNLALCGFSGDGKTSFVNAVRGLRPGMAGFVVSRSSEEGDLRANAYAVLEPPLRVWDMPGGGTSAHPLDAYFEELCVREFDLVLLFYTSRWTSLHDAIVVQAHRSNMLERLVVVVNKATMSLEHHAFDENREVEEVRSQFYASTRSHIRGKLTGLRAEGVPPELLGGLPIYFICTHRFDRREHDEESLLQLLRASAEAKALFDRHVL